MYSHAEIVSTWMNVDQASGGREMTSATAYMLSGASQSSSAGTTTWRYVFFSAGRGAHPT
jgi:hypothetical protein